jgi:hypothetical protein
MSLLRTSRINSQFGKTPEGRGGERTKENG